MSKYKNTSVKGSYTIEASLIFPLVLYIIISLIYLGFYLHDIGKVQAIVDECQFRSKGYIAKEVDLTTGSISYSNYMGRSIFYPIDNNFKSKEGQIKNYINTKSKDKLFISSISNIEAKVSPYSIKLKVVLNFKFPFKSLETFFRGSEKSIIESREKLHNPTDFLRGFQVSYDLIEKVDVINKVTSKLNEIVGALK